MNTNNNNPKIVATPNITRGLMRDHQVSAKKSLGQNFIIEPKIIQRIADAAQCDKHDLILEIGPGLGSLTQKLAEQAGQVVTVEIDKTLLPALAESLAPYNNIQLINDDAMQADFAALVAPYAARDDLRPGFMAVANLPYYITTPLIMRFLEGAAPWRRLVFMVQKEMAERMQAAPGGKDYGALSLAVQYRAKASIAFKVPATVFIPRPKVDSAVIVLDRLDAPPVSVPDEALLFDIIRAGFNQRRKTLANSLSRVMQLDKELITAALTKSQVEPTRRAETLTLAEFAAVASALYHLQNQPQNTEV